MGRDSTGRGGMRRGPTGLDGKTWPGRCWYGTGWDEMGLDSTGRPGTGFTRWERTRWDGTEQDGRMGWDEMAARNETDGTGRDAMGQDEARGKSTRRFTGGEGAATADLLVAEKLGKLVLRFISEHLVVRRLYHRAIWVARALESLGLLLGRRFLLASKSTKCAVGCGRGGEGGARRRILFIKNKKEDHSLQVERDTSNASRSVHLVLPL